MSTPLESQSNATPPTTKRKVILASAALVVLFSLPLFNLIRFAVQSALYSHIVLIPFISLYLARQIRSTQNDQSAPNRPLAVVLFGAGFASLVGWALPVLSGTVFTQQDSLVLTTLSFLCFFTGICTWILGRQTLRSLLFPLAFLLFMVPMPVSLETGIENLLQHGSAAVAHVLFNLAGTTVFVNGLIFQLTTITIQVAPECSGIHSSLALFITSIVAGYFFLRSPTRRISLALAVLPLALLRNGLRVFVLGELCVRIGPEMINSYIHHQGGPIFFAISLLPFSLLLLLLVKSERKARPQP